MTAPSAALQDRRRPALLAAAAGLIGLLLLSGLRPYDRGTWAMEVFPVVGVLPVLALTWRRFPLTTLVYVAIFVHACVLMLGGAYTYARVPLGGWMQETFALSRNPYDRIGHFCQGFIPALAVREILLRGGYVRGARMLAFLTGCVVLAISACYEFLEWGTALALGAGATDFLGTQGDPWDTQWDMFLALVGAITALALLSGVQDRQIERLKSFRIKA